MYPKLFNAGSFEIYSYGLMIMVGASLGYLYFSKTAKIELGIQPEKIQLLTILIIFSAFIGGKLFFYLEQPSFYFNPPSNMLKNLRTGFVFYGSLLFTLPMALAYFRYEKWPIWTMADILAVTATIIHSCGRIGCFLAGCCHGLPTSMLWGVTFTDVHSMAHPLNEPLHPTQLYSVTLILSILGVLLIFKKHRKFDGQLFFVYLILYSLGRSVIEIFRGDLRRGFVIEGLLSHSQFISIIIILGVGLLYLFRWRRSQVN